jgi:hypothetical protein
MSGFGCRRGRHPPERHRAGRRERVEHAARRLARGDDVHSRRSTQPRRELGIGQRAANERSGAGRAHRGTRDGKQVGSKVGDGRRQLI